MRSKNVMRQCIGPMTVILILWATALSSGAALAQAPQGPAFSAPGLAASRYDHPDHAVILARMQAAEAAFKLPASELIRRAEGGDMRAMFVLMLNYQNGIGMERSAAKSESWRLRLERDAAAAGARGDAFGLYITAFHSRLYGNASDAEVLIGYRKAAEAGSAEGMMQVGQAYYHGNGAPVDRVEAFRWFVRAATMGDCEAIRQVGYMLSYSETGATDVVEAVRWYRIAAMNRYGCGNGANYALALFFLEGRGNLARDYGEAFKYFLETSERGNPVGMMQIGFFYENGLGTPVNQSEALKWFKLAGFPSVAAARAEFRRLGIAEPK